MPLQSKMVVSYVVRICQLSGLCKSRLQRLAWLIERTSTVPFNIWIHVEIIPCLTSVLVVAVIGSCSLCAISRLPRRRPFQRIANLAKSKFESVVDLFPQGVVVDASPRLYVLCIIKRRNSHLTIQPGLVELCLDANRRPSLQQKATQQTVDCLF